MLDLDEYFTTESLLQDQAEAASEEFNHVLQTTGGRISSSVISLSIKLSEYPDQDFPISDYSSYKDDVWLLEFPTGSHPVKINFRKEDTKYNGLKRALLYYVIPDFCAFGNIRSYATTRSYNSTFNLFLSYIFHYNHLSPDDPSDIDCISPAILNDALDRAKNNQDTPSHYCDLFRIIRLWLSLSHQEAIPENYRLKINPISVDNKRRSKDVLNHFQGTLSTWLPFSEDELSKLMEYSLFWLEIALPELIKVRDYIDGLDLSNTSHAPFYSWAPNEEFERLTNITIDGINVMSSIRSFQKTSLQSHSKPYVYTWKNQYAIALDHVRNALFILVGLTVGMRAREIGQIMLDDTYKDKNDEYWIHITRFKTTNDPNYQGETEVMPIPYFIGNCIDYFKHLKSLSNFNKEGYLFQSNKSRKVLNNFTSGQIKLITNEIRQFTGIERPHTHRFRKTVAEILINRSEKNIDLIRMLFGHESYAMTLKYIARNPFMVNAIAEAIEVHFTEDFHEVVRNIRDESYSGKLAERIANTMISIPEKFVGKQLKLQIMNYVSHMLSSGEIWFIHRSALGSYCIYSGEIEKDDLLPCLLEKNNLGTSLTPDVNNCHLDCQYCVVLEKSRKAISDNINFYHCVLESTDNIGQKAEAMIRKKLAANEKHLETLDMNHHKVKKALKMEVVQL